MFPPNTQRFEEGAKPSSRLPVTLIERASNGHPTEEKRFSPLLPVLLSEKMSLRVTLGTPAICWSITPKWVDRQTGIITG
jgi:hypothetical protein